MNGRRRKRRKLLRGSGAAAFRRILVFFQHLSHRPCKLDFHPGLFLVFDGVDGLIIGAARDDERRRRDDR